MADKTYGTGKYKNKNKNILSRLSNNTKAWLTVILSIISVITLVCVLKEYETIRFIFLSGVFVGLISFVLWMVKEMIRERWFDSE